MTCIGGGYFFLVKEGVVEQKLYVEQWNVRKRPKYTIFSGKRLNVSF